MALNEALSPVETPTLESRDDATRRLMQLPIVADAPAGVRCAEMHICVKVDEHGTPVAWTFFEATQPNETVEGGDRLDPTAGTGEQAIFDAAANGLRDDDMPFFDEAIRRADGRWWEKDKLDRLPLQEILHVNAVGTDPHADSRSLDVFNFFGKLDEKEIVDVQEAFDILARTTKGKVFDRIKGVALVDGQYLVDHGQSLLGHGIEAEDKDKAWGLFQAQSGVLFVNLETMRNAEASGKPHGLERYTKNSGPISILKRTIVHEGGHSIMEIRYEGDATAHNVGHIAVAQGLSPNRMPPFGDLAELGWRKTESGPNKRSRWSLDDAVAAEVGELPPTDVAMDSPGEDAADSFTIVAFGGDTSTLSARTRLVHDTIAKADGREMDVKAVTCIREEPEPGKPYAPQGLDAIRLSVYVGKGTMPYEVSTSKSRLLKR